MKKIAIFCHNFFANGTVKVALSQAEILQEAGQDVHLFVFHQAGDFAPPQNVTLHYLYGANDKPSIAAQQKKLTEAVAKAEEQGRFDLFLSNSTDCDQVVAGCHFSPCYYFCHCALKQELLMEIKRGPVHFWRRWKKAKALIGKHIITVSHGIADELRHTAWLKPKSVQTIYNPFNINKVIEKSQQPVSDLPNEPYMIHVGRMTKQKRHDILFQALKLMPEAPKLVLLTNRPERARKLAKKYGVLDRIITPGFQQNPFPWIAKAELMLLSSDFEGFGMVIVESLICKTPVISTDCPHGPNEILTDELAHYLVPVKNPKALALKAIECLNSPPNLDNMAILEKVNSRYIAEQYLSLIPD